MRVRGFAGPVAIGALLIACNELVGVGSDYHRVNGTAGTSADSGKSGSTSSSGGASTGGKGGGTSGATSSGGAGAASGGASGSGTSGGLGGAAGSSVSSGGDSGNPGGDGGEAGVVGSGGSSGGAGGSSGRGGKGGSGGKGGVSGTGGGGTSGTGGGGTSGTGGGGTSGTGGGGTSGTGGGGTSGTGGGAGTGGSGGGGAPGVTVALDQTKQHMAGFGLGTAYATALSDAEADALFGTSGNGIGLSILRIVMGTDGNAISSNTWSDAQKAAARGVTTFIGSAYSAPASFKDNNSVNDGGHLKSSSYDAWANAIAAFPAKVKTNVGVDLYAMSLQSAVDYASCVGSEPCNDSYPSMVFTANEYVAFLKVAAPKLHGLAPPVKVIGPEPSEWNHLWSNKSATGTEPSNKNSLDPLGCGFPDGTGCTTGNGYDYGHALYADSTAWGLLDLMGVQQYDSQVADPWPGDVPVKKPVWQTEMSGVKWWPEQGPSTTIDNGIAVAGWIHDAVVNGEASAWLWYTYRASFNDDNEGLLLKDGTDTKRHYTLGNFSKFVRPGDYRVDVTGPIPSGVLLSAFKGADGHVVIVAINTSSSAVDVPISITGGTAPSSMQPWITSSVGNLAGATALALSGGQFTAPLDAKSVTTFYGTAP